MFNPLKHEDNSTIFKNPVPTSNKTMHIHYEDKMVNAV
jgi:hypothetical protein